MEALFYVLSFAAGVLLVIGSCFDVVAAARTLDRDFVRGHLGSAAVTGSGGALLIGHAARWVA